MFQIETLINEVKAAYIRGEFVWTTDSSDTSSEYVGYWELHPADYACEYAHGMSDEHLNTALNILRSLEWVRKGPQYL